MSQTIYSRMIRAAALLMSANNLFADGPEAVLIDQRSAIAGKITAGDAPGFPVTISQPGAYRLSGNLTVPDTVTTAIHIAADFVTLDLNGFAISGPTVCTKTGTTTMCNASGGGVGVHGGDFAPGTLLPRGVRVMNGTVRGMGFHGVRVLGFLNTVEKIYAESNGGPGIVSGGNVVDSVARMNGTTGIIAPSVRGSFSVDNGGIGIFVGGNGVVTGNSVSGNGSDGISVNGPSTLTGNSVNDNGSFGIAIRCPGVIVGNTIIGNVAGALRMFGGVCTLANNTQ